jgi:hypothetical protein
MKSHPLEDELFHPDERMDRQMDRKTDVMKLTVRMDRQMDRKTDVMKLTVRMDRQMDRKTDVMKLTVAFRNFVNAPRNTALQA